jgi:tRNA G18 (ribose-2'-O)-methylase SpoU
MNFAELPQIGPGHAAIKDYLAYRDNLHGNPERLLPIEGVWAHQIALKLKLEIPTSFLCPEMLRSPEYTQVAQELCSHARRAFQLSAKVFDRISERDGPSGIASLVKPKNFFENDMTPLATAKRIVVMDAVEIPGNIGTILRALDGLGDAALVLTSRRVRLTHPKVIKGSLGAIFTVPVVSAEISDLLAYAKAQRIPLLAADSSDKAKVVDFAQAQAPERFVLILGSEKYGLPQEVYDARPTAIKIPMNGLCDSLNVSIAGAILLYGLVYRRMDSASS